MRRYQPRRQYRCQFRYQSVDSSLDEYKLSNSETKYHSGLETEPTDIDDDIDKFTKDAEDAKG